jgi:hypothetical protein
MNAVDLEILLYRTEKDDYGVDLRFRGAGAVDIPLVRGRAEIDVRALDEAIAEDEAGESYGKVLFGQLFTRRRPELINYFDMARVAAQTAGAALRVRLYIDPTASCLHNLRWESLRDPRSGMPLLMGESIHFSRYLSSSDWRPVQLRPQDDLRALVVIADPSDLNEYRMAKVRVADELARAKAGLGAIPATVVTGPGTLGHMMEALHDEHDLLYLVCHGGIDRRTNEPRLWLEGADGRAAVTAGGEVVARLMDLWDRPRLVVLASCQSAGLGEDARSGDDLGVLAAIGPKLAGAGLPAVLAMQGSITMKTVELFMPAFFRVLRENGRVDQAAAVARGLVRDRHDFWVPVLFSRISHGRIWYVPGAAPGTGEQFDGWKGLISDIDEGTCTPILGSGLLEGLIGSTREISRRWAKAEEFAMAPHQREDLPQVTQYLSVMENPNYPRRELRKRLREEVTRRFEVRADKAPVDDLLAAARAERQKNRRVEPHSVLASLPFKIFITTNADDQLRRALVESGKVPRVELCRWHARENSEWPESIFVDHPNYTPQDDRHPLVYHLYGQLQNPDSLVLTEDDYFDYLIGVNQDSSRIPLGIKKTLRNTALLFLGFRMEEWDFRVLFRSILAQGEKGGLNKRFKHIAAQIEPEEGRNTDPEKARRYLQSYFRNADIHIYWGSVEDFTRELRDRWRKGHPVSESELLP